MAHFSTSEHANVKWGRSVHNHLSHWLVCRASSVPVPLLHVSCMAGVIESFFLSMNHSQSWLCEGASIMYPTNFNLQLQGQVLGPVRDHVTSACPCLAGCTSVARRTRGESSKNPNAQTSPLKLLEDKPLETFVDVRTSTGTCRGLKFTATWGWVASNVCGWTMWTCTCVTCFTCTWLQDASRCKISTVEGASARIS